MRNDVKQKIAGFVQKYPGLFTGLISLLRTAQAHFSAGVIGLLADNQGRILLVRHVYHPEFPWGLPGGWVGRNESPQEALSREFQEELGLKISVSQLLLIDNKYVKKHLDIAFLVVGEGEIGRTSHEVLAWEYRKPEEMTELHPAHRAAVNAYIAQVDDGRV